MLRRRRGQRAPRADGGVSKVYDKMSAWKDTDRLRNLRLVFQTHIRVHSSTRLSLSIYRERELYVHFIEGGREGRGGEGVPR